MVADMSLGGWIKREHGSQVIPGLPLGDADAISHDRMQLGEMLGHVGAAAKRRGLCRKRHILPQPVGVVHEVPQHAAGVGVHHVAIGNRRISGADGRDEALPVSPRGHVARLKVERLEGSAPRSSDGVLSLAGDHAAIFQVVFIEDLVFVAFVAHIADVEEHGLPIGVFGHREHRVGRLSLIVPLEAAPDGHRADGVRLVVVDRPLSHIQLVGSLVVEVAVACLPEPMPVVGDIIAMVVLDDGGPFPEVPVEAGRRLLDGLVPDAAARLAAVSIRDLQPGQPARLERLVEAGDPRVTAALRAVLHDDAVLLLGFHRDASFRHIVAERLFHIHMLAGLCPPDRHQAVPMVGRGDGDRIDGRILQHPADIADSPSGQAPSGLLLKCGHRAGEHVGVRVDHGGDFDIVDATEALEMFLTAAIDAHYRDSNTVIGADDACRSTPACVDGQTRGHQGLEKHATGPPTVAHSNGS